VDWHTWGSTHAVAETNHVWVRASGGSPLRIPAVLVVGTVDYGSKIGGPCLAPRKPVVREVGLAVGGGHLHQLYFGAHQAGLVAPHVPARFSQPSGSVPQYFLRNLSVQCSIAITVWY